MRSGFRTFLFGYKKRDVNEYIIKLKSDHKEAMAAVTNRFVETRDENTLLKNALADYKRKENEISAAIITAHTAANETMQKSEQSILDEKKRLMDEMRQLDNQIAIYYSRIENDLVQIIDQKSGYEKDLNELLKRKASFVMNTYDFDKDQN